MDTIVKVGRRKTSVARCFFKPAKKAGSGTIVVNDRPMEVFFPVDILQIKVMQPFAVLNLSAGDYDIQVNVQGGGITGQAEAVRMGFSRVLVEINEENKKPLRAAGFMTRDSRMVERKKYGQPKARKKTQFSKR
jgi:small subunit ribosomal protein S9